MIKRIAQSLVLVSLVGCTSPKPKDLGSQASTFGKKTVIENEFIFSGSKAVVADYLAKENIQGEILPIDEKRSLYQVRYQGSTKYKDFETNLKSKVNFIEPNFHVQLQSNKNVYEWPKDKFFFKQWGLNNVGQSPPFGIPGSEGADMDIMKAWTVTKGSKDIVVAVLDTGVDYTHEDLKDNMWVNFKEAPANGGVPGVDDDGNGYVDDVYGYNFISSETQKLWYGKPGTPDPMDVESGHGTFCAGTIGAVANNNVGIAGINWNVRIMALRFIAEHGGSSADAARGIYYAIDKKVDIISNSWGGSSESQLIQQAIADANKAGILFVVAAGNDGSNNDIKKTYPANYRQDIQGNPLNNVLVVGASDNQDNPALFSNYGHISVDVFAPGVQILGLYPKSLSGGGRPYVVMSGTSMATPAVAGIAGLVLAANPDLKGAPDKVRDRIIRTADVKPSLVGKAVSNGRINAYKAVTNTGTNPTLASNWLESGKSLNARGFSSELVDNRNAITVDKAKAIRLHFDFINIDEPYDSIYIYDKDQRLITQVEQTDSRDYWSPIIPGDTAYVRFVNSKVKQINIEMITDAYSESACYERGATEAQALPNGNYTCSVDDDDADGSSKPYTTFNSEGFSIDRVQYLASDDTSGGLK